MWRALGITLLALVGVVRSESRTAEVVGYLENWNDVDWWQNNVPGNCRMGCAKPDVYMAKVKNYTVVNYGFSFLTTNPNPAQVNCTNGECPVWKGDCIWLAASGKEGACAVNSNSSVTNYSPGVVAMGEVVRLSRMGPTGPIRCKITLGGWSDWARLGSVENAQKVAKLVGKMVAFTFADGIDLDFEHLTPFSKYPNDDEFAAFAALINGIREEFKTVAANWKSTAAARIVELEKEYEKLPPWQKKESPYFNTSIKYLQELQNNTVPYLEISYTTRFNAFINTSDPWNYLMPNSPIPHEPFATDNEGAKLWPLVGDSIDSVNVMAYDAGSDAGPLQLNFQQILKNFAIIGKVPKAKINMGFEPGGQAAGGHWEGLKRDVQVTRFIKANGYGGAMIWAINDKADPFAPVLAGAISGVLEPVYPYRPAPTYTKVDPKTGWLPGLEG